MHLASSGTTLKRVGGTCESEMTEESPTFIRGNIIKIKKSYINMLTPVCLLIS
jgi:hypothetical protein